MSFYIDPVLTVRQQLEEMGAKASFVDQECGYISSQVIAGEWLQIPADDGLGMQCVRKIAKRPAESVEEYCAALIKAKPHALFEAAVVDDAELAFGANPTLKARGQFYKDYGAAVYAETQRQWRADDSLRAGTRPTATHDGAGKKLPPPEGSSSNPWSIGWHGNEASRHEKIGSILKSMGTKGAAELAKAAGTTITRPLMRKAS